MLSRTTQRLQAAVKKHHNYNNYNQYYHGYSTSYSSNSNQVSSESVGSATVHSSYNNSSTSNSNNSSQGYHTPRGYFSSNNPYAYLHNQNNQYYPHYKNYSFTRAYSHSSVRYMSHNNDISAVTGCSPDSISNKNEIDIYVQANYDDGSLKITYFNDGLKCLNRPINEPLANTLKRFQLNLRKGAKSNSTKSKKGSKSEVQENDLPPAVIYRGDPMEINTLTNENWKNGMIVHIDTFKFRVIINPPMIEEITIFPKRTPMVGAPIVPLYSGSNFEEDCAKYFWHREEFNDPNGYHLVSEERIYIPTPSDVGHRLRFTMIPGRRSEDLGNVDNAEDREAQDVVLYGMKAAAYSTGSVTGDCSINSNDGGIPTTLAVRQSYLDHSKVKLSTTNNIRIVTYNILAEVYATSEFAVNSIYPYCKEEFLQSEYRLQLVMQELMNYNADIIALQECDAKYFTSYFKPGLESLGYSGWVTTKASISNEGCALFVNNKTLRIIKTYDFSMRDYMKNCSQLAPLLASRPDVNEILTKHLGMIAQILVVEKINNNSSSKGNIMVFGNTHLFYHPNAAYIRLLQADSILKRMIDIKSRITVKDGIISVPEFECPGLVTVSVASPETSIAQQTTSDNSGKEYRISLGFLGDLNSTPDSALVEYMLRGHIPRDHWVWETMNQFAWGMRMEGHPKNDSNSLNSVLDKVDVSNVVPELTLPSGFTSLFKPPLYTNYTASFKDMLDYVYIDSDSIESFEVAPFPTELEMSKETALPCATFPSDHVSLLADVVLKL